MKRAQWLWLALSVAGLGLVGCGDDDGVTPPVDGGGTDGGGSDAMVEPPACQMPDVQSGACCYRESNADQLDAPELRIAYLGLETPRTLMNMLVSGILNQAIREERFNWLIRLEGADADGPVTIVTGYGSKSATGTFAFADGDAPGENPTRWDPQSLEGTLAGETVSTGSLTEVFTVPVQNDDGSVILELPLRGFRLVNATLSEERSCIGSAVSATRFNADAGEVETYITVEDARMGMVDAGGIMSTLCNILRGAPLGDVTDCEETARSEWAVPPDSTCEGGACTLGGCTADTCNAWQVVGGFAAQGVDITN